MHPTNLTPKWKHWIKPSRLIPYLTILTAGSVGVLSYLGIVALSIPESIIIVLLGLLAIDALIERIDVLERIENKLNNATIAEPLKSRNSLAPIREIAINASEICVIAVAGTTLITYHHNFFESLVRNGCKIRIILLNPDGASLQTWNLQSKIPRSQEFIRTSLASLENLVQLSKVKGKCEVRLINIVLPFSMFAIDSQKSSGSITVEYHIYNDTPEERPHISLTPLENPYWYNFYRQQFEQVWAAATVWTA